MLIRTFVFVLVVSLLPSIGVAQWVSDSTTNTVVCTATSIQDYPSICTDGADGAIVVWEDLRGDGAYIVYAQHLGSDGRPTWHSNGVRLTYGVYSNQRFPVAASDGRGGAYVVWQDYRNGTQGTDLYSQHINASGIIMYDSVGKAVAFAAGDQANQQIVADGYGNAFVIWEDSRSSITENNPDIYMNRLTPIRVAFDTTGALLSGQSGKQRHPQICEDGSGGFYAAWESSGTNPISIYAQRVDSTGHLLWTTPYGVSVYQGSNGGQNAKSVSIRRDGSQLMLAWEVTNLSANNGQDIYANRMTSSGTKLYSPIEVAIDYPGDQANPEVFSDDSAEAVYSNYPGLLVLFENSFGSFPQTLQAVRIFSDGITRQPPSGAGFYQVSYSNAFVNGYRALRVAPGAILTMWNDGRSDSSIYSQRLDRPLQRDFPTPNTKSTWGLPIRVRPTSQSKQLALAPRTNGAIAAWTDYRNGNADIYAQLIFKDGSLPIELEQFQATCPHRGEVDIAWKTASENGNAGFEIERRVTSSSDPEDYHTIASYTSEYTLRGAGTSSIEHRYGYIDRDVEPAIYEYRLIELALDGTRTAHQPVQVDARMGESVAEWSVGPNVPNPFIEQTTIPVSLPVDAIVDLSFVDGSGRTVATAVNHRLLAAGQHEVHIDSHLLDGVSGSYFVRMTAFDPATGGVLWHAATPTVITLIK